MSKKSFITILIFLFCSFNFCEAQNKPKQELDTEVGKMRFDASITGFKLAIVISDPMAKKYIFSEHGEADLKNKIMTTGFYFKPVKFMDHISAKGFINESVAGYSTDKGIVKVEIIKKQDTVINNLKIYIVTLYTIDKAQRKCFIIESCSSDEKSTVLFMSNEYNKNSNAEKFIKTIRSIEF